MRIGSCVLFGVLLAAAVPVSMIAQMPAGVHESLTSLADQPSTHFGFVLDRSMLQAARGILEQDGISSKRAADISSISVDSYRYPQPAMYVPEAFASVVNAYREAGWKHLVDAHEPRAGESSRRVATDLWLHYTGGDIDGLTVLTRGSRDMNAIQVACHLRPLDLVHLGGHFGIPKVNPDAVMVPAPEGR